MTNILSPSRINASIKQSDPKNISTILDYKDTKRYASRLLNISSMVILKEKIDKLVKKLTPVNVENDDETRDNKIAFKQINVPDIYNMTELVIKGIDDYPEPFVYDAENKDNDTTGVSFKNYIHAKAYLDAATHQNITVPQVQKIVDDYESKMEKLNEYIKKFEEYIEIYNNYMNLNLDNIDYSDLNEKFPANRKESFKYYTEYVYKNCLIDGISTLILVYSYNRNMRNEPHAININDDIIESVNNCIVYYNEYIDICNVFDVYMSEKVIESYKDAAKQKINSLKPLLISLMKYYNKIYDTLEFKTMINTTNKNMDLIMNAIIQYADKHGDILDDEQKVAIETCRDYYVNKYKYDKIVYDLSAYNIKKFDIDKNILYSNADKYKFAVKIDEDKLSNNNLDKAITFMTLDKYPPSIIKNVLDINKITITSIEDTHTKHYNINTEQINNQNWFKELSEESQTKLLNDGVHNSVEIYRTSFEIFPECKPDNQNNNLLIDEFCRNFTRFYYPIAPIHRNFLVIEFYKKYIEIVGRRGNKHLKAVIDTDKPAKVYISILWFTDENRLYDMVDDKFKLIGNLYFGGKISENVLCFNYKPLEKTFVYSTIGMKFANDKNFVINCVNKLSVRNRLKVQDSKKVDAGNKEQQLKDLILNNYILSPDGKILYPKDSEHSAFNSAIVNRYKYLGGYNNKFQQYEDTIIVYYVNNKIYSSTLKLGDLILENLPTTYNQLDETFNYIKFIYDGEIYVLMFSKVDNEYVSDGQIYIVGDYDLIPTEQRVSIFFLEFN